MKKIILTSIIAGIISLAGAGRLFAQNNIGGVADFNRLVYDFGDILTSAGPVSCDFTFTNTGKKAIVIYNVVTSCGCTDVKWTEEPVKPGKTGTITATFKNEDGPLPFDKTLTAYLSDIKSPVILHLRGIVHETKLPLAELYNVHFGNFAIKEQELKGVNLQQGQQKSGEVKVANIGKRPVQVSFSKVSEGLTLSITPNPIPSESLATLRYTVTASRSRWGKNWYYATPVVDGRTYKSVVLPSMQGSRPSGAEAVISESNDRIESGTSEIGVWAVTRENFSEMTSTEKNDAPNPLFESSSFPIGQIKAGGKIKVTFNCTNSGKSELKFYRLDSDSKRVLFDTVQPIKGGSKGKITMSFNTAGLPKGEILVIVRLTTNSPLRPLVNLYITGFII